MPEEASSIKLPKNHAVTPRELVYKYLPYVPWLVISVAVILTLAYIKLHYSVPIYSVAGKLLVAPRGGSAGGDRFDDLFMSQGNIKINDEIEIIKSRSIAARVIRRLALQTTIINQGKIRNTLVHPLEAPFLIDIPRLNDSTGTFYFMVTLQDDGYTINEETQKHYYGELIQPGLVQLRILKSSQDWRVFGSNKFLIYRQDIESMSAGLSGSISVSPVGDMTNVLSISYQTENIRLGLDIVNQYMYEYQENSLEDKREIAANVLQFISQQLDTVRYDLGGVESNLQRFQETNRIIDPGQQASIYFGQLTQNDNMLAAQTIKLRTVDLLLNIVSDQKDPYKIVPSILGTDEPVLLQQVSEYNKLQLERETALKTTPVGNPLIQEIETGLEKLRGDMIVNLQNVKKTYQLVYDDLRSKIREADARIGSIPAKEKRLLEVRRQQNILQELYSFLLQKKLETAIGSASTISNIKVVDTAIVGGLVSPNRKGIYIMAIMVGLAIPTGIIALKEILNDKVKSKSDIQNATNAPIVGEIGHTDDSSALVVKRNDRKFLAEQFRIVRSNLQYIFPKITKPVILVTSSISGEGKSFVSTNMGAVLALTGRRTVILEFDIRKPKILKGLGLNERLGITNFIVGNIQLEAIIYPVPEVENLFVIPCGPVPPNPGEILLDPKVSELFKLLREQFDTIIVDTAPVGLVSDGITLGQHADASIYIVRHNYTLKKQVEMIEDLYSANKLPHISIIINDIIVKGGYGYYGYGGHGYGYGYGYGQRSNYYDEENHKPGFLKKLLGVKSRKK